MSEEYWKIAGIPLTLKWSKRRKTIGLKVQDGLVSVSAPRRTPKIEIENFVRSKVSWLAKHLAEQRHNRRERDYINGAELPYLGEALRLVFCDEGEGELYRCGDELIFSGVDQNDKPLIKTLLVQWLESQALAYLAERVDYFAEQMFVSPNAIKVRHYKTRWGSCNHKGELQFNWQIMLASREVVDYVVVHELAHLKHFDHSPAFWRLVESIMPDYAVQRNFLRRNAFQLNL